MCKHKIEWRQAVVSEHDEYDSSKHKYVLNKVIIIICLNCGSKWLLNEGASIGSPPQVY